MDAGGSARCAGIAAHLAEESPGFNPDLTGSRWECCIDKRIALYVGHVGVVGPDLATGLEGVGGDADDDRRFPLRQAGEVAGIGGIYGGNTGLHPTEDIQAGMAERRSEGVAPKKADVSLGRELEGGVTTARPGGDMPASMTGGVTEELTQTGKAGKGQAGGTVDEPGGGEKKNDDDDS